MEENNLHLSNTVTNDELEPVIYKDSPIKEYYFESDALALKNNKDYQNLLEALVKLQSQRIKAVKDCERLQEAQENSLKDPIGFVKALQEGHDLRLPASIDCAKVPEIDWQKYNIESITQSLKPQTRKKQFDNQTNEPEKNNEGLIKVRGKFYNEKKPQTFNQSWSVEEQRKLEELLIEFPDEYYASKRWAKIANALGTRTPLQVQSRCQKYFLALKKEGLPIPGKIPRNSSKGVRGRKRRELNFNSEYVRSFTRAFDEEHINGTPEAEFKDPVQKMFKAQDFSVSDEEDICPELKSSKEYLNLLKLKRARDLKHKEIETGVVVHPGYACDGCGVDPITGTRWHCVDCPASVSTDLCDTCAKMPPTSSVPSSDSQSGLTQAMHLSSHILQPIRALCLNDTFAGVDEQ